MQKIITSLVVAGIAAFGAGVGAGAVTNGAPTVTPSSGGPGFEFTVGTLCTPGETVIFTFPPDPPAQTVVCPGAETTTTTTVPETTTTTTSTTTTTVPETTSTTTSTTTTTVPETTSTTTSTITTTTTSTTTTTIPECIDGVECNPELLRQVAQADPAVQQVSASFTAPQAAGTYSGTVQTQAGTQTFTSTVVDVISGGGSLPDTGPDAAGWFSVAGIGFLAAGAALAMIARRRDHLAAD